MSDSDPLQDLIAEIAAAPQSAAGLTLYALISTLEFERAGYLFKLIKLRDLSTSQRDLAYRLMEMMALGQNQGEAWQEAKRRIDALINAG